jgi:hypothetical protein
MTVAAYQSATEAAASNLIGTGACNNASPVVPYSGL